MTTIWKYQLNITDRQHIEIPCEHEILSVAVQNGVLCMWAEVNPNAYLVDIGIEIIGTGNPIYEGNREFIGTVVMHPFVWHVYKNTVDKQKM